MIRRSINKLLHAPWPSRWLNDIVAVALATAILPKVGERLNLQSATGFALVMVTATALLLAASWAMLPPARRQKSSRASSDELAFTAARSNDTARQ